VNAAPDRPDPGRSRTKRDRHLAIPGPGNVVAWATLAAPVLTGAGPRDVVHVRWARDRDTALEGAPHTTAEWRQP